jgi:hypothetical protein
VEVMPELAVVPVVPQEELGFVGHSIFVKIVFGF